MILNYNDPIEVTELFRVPIAPEEEGEEYSEEIREILTKNTKTAVEYEYEEFSLKRQVCWEDIKSIRQYGFKDNWKKYKGEKYLIHLSYQPEEVLVFGNYQAMCEYWREFRNTYPLFKQ